MLNDFIYAIGILLVLCGLFFVCYIILKKVITPKGYGGFLAVIPGKEDDDSLPEKVYAAFIQANLLTLWEHNEVVVLDLGVSEKIKEQCRNIMCGKGDIAFCKADDFESIVN